MIPLASSEFAGIAWLVILVIAGIGKLIAKSVDSVKPPPPPVQRRPAMARESTLAAGGDSEAERTRQFLEALGLPSTTLEPKPADVMRGSRETVRHAPAAPLAPPVLPPQQMRGSRESLSHAPAPAPRSAQKEFEARRQENKRRAVQQQRQARRAAPVSETYDGAIERLHFAELKTPTVDEFHTKSSEVSAIPFEAAGSVVGQLYIKEGTERQNELLKLARSPKALRQAILLREILGPPRSLQSDFGTSSLAPL